MKINRNNYEAYFLDYAEGNLDAALVNDFIDFLQKNPDLKAELELFESFEIPTEDISFQHKKNLYKEKFDDEYAFNKAAVARLENTISEKENNDFNRYLNQHPEKQKDILLFAKTKLIPDSSIVFPKKNKLYQNSAGRIVLLWSGRVAALLILALAIFSLIEIRKKTPVQQNQIAVVDEKHEKKTTPPTTQQIPSKPEKTIPVSPKKETPKSKIKKVLPKKQSNKQLRENNTGRLEQNDFVAQRTPLEVPKSLSSIAAFIEIPQPEIALATIKTNRPATIETINDERLLADIIKEKTGLNKFSFRKVTHAGLNLVSNFTKDNFSYDTGDDGKVTEYRYNSRLLAFSIPAGKNR